KPPPDTAAAKGRQQPHAEPPAVTEGLLVEAQDVAPPDDLTRLVQRDELHAGAAEDHLDEGARLRERRALEEADPPALARDHVDATLQSLDVLLGRRDDADVAVHRPRALRGQHGGSRP